MKQETKYKDTAVGKIPEDWEVKHFDEIFTFLRTNSFSRDNLTYDEINNEIFNIHYGDIHATFKEPILDFNKENNIPKVKDEFIEKIKISEDDYLKDGDLIIADASEDYEGLCDSVEIINLENRKAVSGLHTFAVRANKDNIAKGFNAYILRSQQLKKEFRRIATGISVLGVSKTNLSKVKLPIPPLPEQKAIADVLSTWDKAIEKHEQLIAQKELRKKGLMQRLLNEKFKEKNEKWEEVRLGEIGETFNGLTGKNKDDFGDGCTYVSYLNVFNNNAITEDTDFDFVKINEGENQTRLKYGDLIFTTSSETPDEVGMSSVILFKPKEDLFLNSFCFGLRMEDFEKLEPHFAVHLLRGNQFRKEMYKLAQGSTRFNLSKAGFKNIVVSVPPIEEQNRIAKILQTADKEIQLLKEKKEWLREQKKGLMQMLLTGKKRLNYDLVD